MLRVLTLLSLLACALPATAGPTAQDIGRAHAESERAVNAAGQMHPSVPTDVLKKASRALTRPADNPQATTSLPKSVPWDKAQADIRALLANPDLGRTEALKNPTSTEDTPPLVFVSFSMPEASLRRLLAESARAGAPVVLRGLAGGSLKETVQRLAQLLPKEEKPGHDEHSPSLLIDPTLYTRFGIEQVPAFVLPRTPPGRCTADPCVAPPYTKVAGDVDLAYALDVISRQARDPTARRHAQAWLDRLKAER